MLFTKTILNILSRNLRTVPRIKQINSKDCDVLPLNTLQTFEPKQSVLDTCKEDISHVGPYLKPTFNFAAYVNESATLQELLKLGVDLHKLEKKVTVPRYIMGLDFERDVKGHVIFLHEIGLTIKSIGGLITKNPYIFKQSLDDLRVRVNYLSSKSFTDDEIVRIVGHNPYWLMFSTNKIDERLGFFQKEFELTGPEVRQVTAIQPRLITYKLQDVKTNMFAIHEEMGFTIEERKAILLKRPQLFMKKQTNLLEIFEYLHRDMKISTETLAQVPGILTCRLIRLQQRHKFLEKLGKAQFNPKEPRYVALLDMASGSDVEFCENVAKCPLESFHTFLKTL